MFLSEEGHRRFEKRTLDLKLSAFKVKQTFKTAMYKTVSLQSFLLDLIFIFIEFEVFDI